MKTLIKIGSRTSALAMVQTKIVIAALQKVAPEVSFEIIPLRTLGDQILDKPLLSFGGKGAFVSEFEEALLKRKIDLAVHSAKDMPIILPEGLEIVGVPQREDPRDVLVTLKGTDIKEGAVIGTSSLRRQYQIQSYQKVSCKDLRGNVSTRLKKLEERQYDGIILAAAGLKRLGLHQKASYKYHYFSPIDFVPAGGQGIIAVEGRKDDQLSEMVSRINDEAALISLQMERQVLRMLGAGCHDPIGVFTSIEGQRLTLTIMHAIEKKPYKVMQSAFLAEREQMARLLVKQLKEKDEGMRSE